MPCEPTACVVATAAALSLAYAFSLAYTLHNRLRLAEAECHAEALARAAEAVRKNELALELMLTRNKLMITEESVGKGRTFVPAPSDVSARPVSQARFG